MGISILYRHFVGDLSSRLMLILSLALALAIVLEAGEGAVAGRMAGIIALGVAVSWVVDAVAARRPAWRSAGMVPVAIVCFALLLERGGMLPASIALILVSSMGLEDCKPGEIVASTVMLGLLGAELAPLLWR